MIQTFKQNLGPVADQSAPFRLDLLRGVNFHSLVGRVTASVEISGGSSSGTPVAEGVQRLIRAIRINHDGRDRIERLDGRQLYKLTSRTRYTITQAVQVTSGDAATYPVSFDFVIPIAQPWTQRPIETAWPGNLPVRTQLAAWIEFLPVADRGAALISGGDRTISVDDLQVQVWQEYSTGVLPEGPYALTEILTDYTTQFSAANSNLPLLIDNNKPISFALLRALDGATQEAAAIVNTLSLESGFGATNYFKDLDFTMLQREEAGAFPAVEESGQVGEIGVNFCQNGMLSLALDPRTLNDPRWVFDVDAPSNPGVVQATYVQLASLPGVTRF
jgi:hypothetical protein